MQRSSVTRLSAWIAAVGACLALGGGSVLLSAQGAHAKSPQMAQTRKGALKQAVGRLGKRVGSKPGTLRTKGALQVGVSGVVTDGSGAGWPLYSRLEFTSDMTEPLVVFTDPVTGAYAAQLFDGVEYTVAISAVGPGYVAAEETVTSAGAPIELDVALAVNAVVCSAPGYTAPAPVLSESFDAGTLPAGWSVVNNSDDGGGPWGIFIGVDPACPFGPANLTGGSGGYAIVNSDCDGEVTDDTELISPSLDFSAASAVSLSFNQDFNDFSGSDEFIDVDVSTDGGIGWTNVYHQGDNVDLRGPSVVSIDISAVAAGHHDVKIRFHYANAFFAFWWEVDNVIARETSCIFGEGLGLVVGNVSSAATNAALNGATVTFAEVAVAAVTSTTTFAVPEDPNQPGGFYIIAAPSPAQTLETSAKKYAPVVETPAVEAGNTVRQDFELPSAALDVAPRPVTQILNAGETGELEVTLSNTGEAGASFQIQELNTPSVPPPPATFASPADIRAAKARIPTKFRWDGSGLVSVRGLPPMERPSSLTNVPRLAGGMVINTFPTGFPLPFGAMFNLDADDIWISSVGFPFPGDGLDHLFTRDGTDTGDTIDMNALGGIFPLDGTYNSRTQMLWQATADFLGGTITCVYELDPATSELTGNTICPEFASPQQGLAYDPTTDTYYSGSFFDGVITQFDSQGNILGSSYTGLNISGLAYNPATRHLFVASQNLGAFNGPSIFVLDPANEYAVLGAFLVPGFTTGASEGGLEMSCDGHLWLVDQIGLQVWEVDSGETGVCNFKDIPWLSEDPTEGSVDAGGSVPVTLSFDAASVPPGLHSGFLLFPNDSPNPVDPLPVFLTVRFGDVADNDLFAPYIYAAAGSGLMTGCGAGDFCSGNAITRADMAGYIERAIHGAGYLGTPYINSFTDVTQQTPNATYIQSLVDEGITAGCGPGLYCPSRPNTRAEMAVFVVKAVEGFDFVPPDCIGIFDDVPCTSGFARYIEYLFNQGVTAGCGNGSTYCPDVPITNGQLAVFLVKAFHIPHL